MQYEIFIHNTKSRCFFILEFICYLNKIKILYLTLDGPYNPWKKNDGQPYDPEKKLWGDLMQLKNIMGWPYDPKNIDDSRKNCEMIPWLIKIFWDDLVTLGSIV